MSKPNILAISQLPPPYGGLANNMELYLSSSLADKYHFQCLNLSSGSRREKDPDQPSLPTALYAVSTAVQLVYRLLTTSPALVYLKIGTKWGFFRDLCLILICKLFGLRTVCHLHSRSSHTLFLDQPSLRKIFCWVMRLPDTVIVLSEQLKNDFCQLIPADKLEVVNNIVDTSVYARQAPTQPDASDSSADTAAAPTPPTTVLFVGRLSKAKGIWDLLHSMPALIATYPDLRLVLAGVANTDQEEQEIKDYCQRQALTAHIRFLDNISGHAKQAAFINADLLVLPTWNDNVPNVVLEAFAARLPVLSTTVGQLPELVENNVNGFLVPPRQPEQLAEKLGELLASPQLRRQMGETNYRKARDKYDIKVGVARMRQIFDALLKGKV